jgi:hypothetical protein
MDGGVVVLLPQGFEALRSQLVVDFDAVINLASWGILAPSGSRIQPIVQPTKQNRQ